MVCLERAPGVGTSLPFTTGVTGRPASRFLAHEADLGAILAVVVTTVTTTAVVAATEASTSSSASTLEAAAAVLAVDKELVLLVGVVLVLIAIVTRVERTRLWIAVHVDFDG